MPTLIANIAELKTHRAKLHALGFTTLEQLHAAAQVAGPELQAYLKQGVDELLSSIQVSIEAMPSEALNEILNAEYSLGVGLDVVPRLTVAPTFTIVAEPPSGCANLVHQMPPIRNQRQRGTCVAFASAAAYEQSLFSQGSQQDFSEQFLYWDCKSNDGSPTTRGTYLGVAFPGLWNHTVRVHCAIRRGGVLYWLGGSIGRVHRPPSGLGSAPGATQVARRRLTRSLVVDDSGCARRFPPVPRRRSGAAATELLTPGCTRQGAEIAQAARPDVFARSGVVYTPSASVPVV